MIIGYEAKRIFHNRSGLGHYGRNLLSGLAQYYPENQYRLYNPWPGKVEFNPAKCVTEVCPPYRTKLLAQIWRRRLVAGRVAREGVEVFHGLSGELPQGLKKTPAVVTMHDLIFMRYPKLYKAIDRRVYRRKALQAGRSAQVIVAVSQQTRRDLIDLLDLPAHKIKVIFQSCAPEFWRDQSALWPALERQWALPERFVLFVGSLEKRKNPVLLAQVCAELKIPLRVVGRPTPYWERFWQKRNRAESEYVQQIKIDDTSQLAALYQRASLFAYPSIFEGFGIPLLEAMASGTPVLTARNSALQEVAGPGSVLVDELQHESLNEALQELWESPESYAARSQKNRHFAEQFTDRVLTAQWMETYRELTT